MVMINSIPSLTPGLDGPSQKRNWQVKTCVCLTLEQRGLVSTVKNPVNRAKRKQHDTIKMRLQNGLR